MCSACFTVHIAAGLNALRRSGPGQKRAFDNALALVGCLHLKLGTKGGNAPTRYAGQLCCSAVLVATKRMWAG